MTFTPVTPLNPFEAQAPQPQDSRYGEILYAYLNGLPPAQIQQIWNDFCLKFGVSPSAPQSGHETDLVGFIENLISTKAIFLSTTVTSKLSPDEIKKRNIMFAVFSGLINMMSTMQNTVSVEGTNLGFYGQWQQQLTNQLTGVPTYVGGASSAVHVDLTNLSKFTFGYDNISVEDIAKWWANNIATGTTQTFSMEAPTGDANNTPTLQFRNDRIVLFRTATITPTTEPVAGALLAPPSTNTFAQNVAFFENQFRSFWTSSTFQNFFHAQSGGTFTQSQLALNFWNNLPSTDSRYIIFDGAGNDPATDPYIALRIIQPYAFIAPANLTSSTDPLFNKGEATAKARAELNSRDQQYIENIRSNRQTIQNQQQQIQTNLSNTQQSFSNEGQLITSILQSLQGMIAAIFR